MSKQEFTITVYTENQVGLINRIAILFSRRKININKFFQPVIVDFHNSSETPPQSHTKNHEDEIND